LYVGGMLPKCNEEYPFGLYLNLQNPI